MRDNNDVIGTEDFVFESNHVSRCDGIGFALSNYNRNATIIGNEFSWIGGSALSGFGSMGDCLYQNCSTRLDYPSGLDGRGGNQPRYTRIVGNLVREIGIWQHQSSAWASHLTAATHMESNVFFNGPQVSVTPHIPFFFLLINSGNAPHHCTLESVVSGLIVC